MNAVESRHKTEAEKSIRSLLQDDEELIMIANIHEGIFWKSIALVILTIILLIKVFNLGVFMAIVTFITFSLAFLTKHYLILALTDKRVFVRHGILKLDVIQLRHSRIESVETERTPMGRILGYATVLVTGTGSRVTAVPFIGNAVEFRHALDKFLLERDEAEIK